MGSVGTSKETSGKVFDFSTKKEVDIDHAGAPKRGKYGKTFTSEDENKVVNVTAIQKGSEANWMFGVTPRTVGYEVFYQKKDANGVIRSDSTKEIEQYAKWADARNAIKEYLRRK